jgi:hypothetical protein
MSEELNKAKTAAEELKSTIEDYDSAVAKLKTLTQGTEEWKKVLNEANTIALKLIEENQKILAG